MFESLTLSNLTQRQRVVLREPSSTRPTLRCVEENGIRAIVKDYSTNRFLYRNTFGRFLIWRESKAYRRLKGLRGVPVFYRAIDGLALVISEIPGKSLEGLEREERLPETFFEELRGLVEQVHGRGLAHCDLKRAPNILQGRDGKPHIVDWSASICEREFRCFPLNRVYRRFLQDDLNGITKIQLRHCPDTVSPEQRRRYRERSGSEKLIRSMRDLLRDLLQKLA